MSDEESHRNPVEELAEEFLARYRRGERPALTEYVTKHPALADEIRDLFPALVMMEVVGPPEPQPGGAVRGSVTADGKALEQVGDYRILREVGRGGMGIVYEAEQEALGRHVALKVLPFQAADEPTSLKRFHREARSAARLHHTNIVPVFDVGECDGLHYYAMQFIRGQSLDEVLVELKRLRSSQEPLPTPPPTHLGAPTRIQKCNLTVHLAQGLATGQFARPESRNDPGQAADSSAQQPLPLPIPESADVPEAVAKSSSELTTASDFHYYRGVARLGLQAAEALAYAHGHKVLHRDIKPANLLLDLQGTLWVTDFGLAKEEGDDLTQTGDMVGTLRYMAPERFSGVSDPRGDVYSLGLTLYELLALRPAYEESDRAKLIWRVTHEDPPPPRRLDRRVPRDLETIVLKALAKEPRGRYQTAEELAEDLRRFLADRPIQARRASWREQAWRWCHRNPTLATLNGAVVALVLLGILGTAIAAVRLKHERDDATAKLFESLLYQARAGRFSRQMGQRFDSLDAVAKAARIRRDDKLRDEATAAMALPDLRHGPSWEAAPPGTRFLAFDPSYRLYARATDAGVIVVYRLADHQEVYRVAGRLHSNSLLQFSPKGQFLAGLDDTSRMTVWRLRDGQAVIRSEPSTYCSPAFSLDGRYVFLGQADRVARIDLTTGKKLNGWPLPASPWSLAVSPDGQRLAVGYLNLLNPTNSVSVFEAATGQPIAELRAGPLQYTYVTWHPDGNRLGIASDTPPFAQIWDITRNRRLVTLEGHVQRVVTLSFHPDGELAATFSHDGTLRLWDPTTGRQLLQLAAAVTHSYFSADGRYLGLTWRGREAQLLEVAAGREYRTLVSSLGAGQGGYYHSDISPDDLLAVGMEDQTRLWDLASGRELAALPGNYLGVQGRPLFRESANGRELVTGTSVGWFRWSLAPDPAKPSALRLGPPRLLPLLRWPGLACLSTDGRFLATSYDGAGPIHVLDFADLTVKAMRGTHSRATAVALSPDGRWVATGGWWTPTVRVWDARTGAMVHEWREGTQTNVFFTPDSRMLITATGSAYHFWNVDTWREMEERRLTRDLSLYPGYVAFSPDGRLMALDVNPGEILFLEATSGRTVARLQDPHGDRNRSFCFSPDGSRLVAVAQYAKALHVWDLRLIRQRLKTMDLDWDWPEFPPAPEAEASRPPRTITVDPGRLWQYAAFPDPRHAVVAFSLTLALNPLNPEAYRQRGLAYDRVRDARRAVADYGAFLAFVSAAHPHHAEVLLHRALKYERLKDYTRALADLEQLSNRADKELTDWRYELALLCNSLAWHFVQQPAKGHAPDHPLRLARKAAALAPDNDIYQNTLGVALYRLGRYQEAISCLEANRKIDRDFAGFDLYFLAMSYQRLGQTDNARDLFDRANAWCQERKDLSNNYLLELNAFRTEAAAVLGLPE